MERQDTLIANLPREQPTENEVESGNEENYQYEIEVGRNRLRGVRHGRGYRRNNPRGRNGEYGNLGNIKMNMPSFHGMNDPKVYLELEKKVKLIFDCHNYSKEKKLTLAVIEFTDNEIIWWDQLVSNRRRNHERPVETWREMKALMRKRFIPSHSIGTSFKYYKALHKFKMCGGLKWRWP